MLVVSILLIVIIVILYLYNNYTEKWNNKQDACFEYPNPYTPVYIKYNHQNVTLIVLARLCPMEDELYWIPVNQSEIHISDKNVQAWISKTYYESQY